MDATLVRVLDRGAHAFTGVPVVLYIVALFVIPEEEPEPTSAGACSRRTGPARDRPPDRPTRSGAARGAVGLDRRPRPAPSRTARPPRTRPGSAELRRGRSGTRAETSTPEPTAEETSSWESAPADPEQGAPDQRRDPAAERPAGPQPATVDAARETGPHRPTRRAECAPTRVVTSADACYSHSMVPGGLLVMSSTTRLTSRTSLVIRVLMRLQHLVGQPAPVGGHRVLAGHRAQHDRVTVRPAVALDPDRADVGQQHDRELPDVAVEPGRGELGPGDRVGPRGASPSRSAVTSPMTRMASPGPGTGAARRSRPAARAAHRPPAPRP